MKIILSLFATLCFVNTFAQDKVTKEETKTVIPNLVTSTIPQPVITKHQVTINGQTFGYTATTGYMTLKDESGKAKGNIFFIAYTKDVLQMFQSVP